MEVVAETPNLDHVMSCGLLTASHSMVVELRLPNVAVVAVELEDLSYNSAKAALQGSGQVERLQL